MTTRFSQWFIAAGKWRIIKTHLTFKRDQHSAVQPPHPQPFPGHKTRSKQNQTLPPYMWIRSDKTGQLMTFQARELWFEPTCVQVCSWKHWFLMDFILLQSLEMHMKSLPETSWLHSGTYMDCKSTRISERHWFRLEYWEYWGVIDAFFCKPGSMLSSSDQRG